MKSSETHFYPVKVPFDDVDAGGVLHHPNYLVYFERARCAAMEESGASFKLMLEEGFALAVAELHVKYKRPVFHLDSLVVASRLIVAKRGSLVLKQALIKEPYERDRLEALKENLEATENLRCVAEIRLACVELKTLRPHRIPEKFCTALELVI